MPDTDKHRKHGNSAAPYDGQVKRCDGEDVAEQEPHQIDPHPAHEGQDHQTDSQRGMRQQTKQRVGGQAGTALQQHQQQRDNDGDAEDGKGDVQLEQQRQRHTQQRRMRQRVTKIGKPAPDDETSQRSGHQRDTDPANNSAGEKIIKHRCPPRCHS